MGRTRGSRPFPGPGMDRYTPTPAAPLPGTVATRRHQPRRRPERVGTRRHQPRRRPERVGTRRHRPFRRPERVGTRRRRPLRRPERSVHAVAGRSGARNGRHTRSPAAPLPGRGRYTLRNPIPGIGNAPGSVYRPIRGIFYDHGASVGELADKGSGRSHRNPAEERGFPIGRPNDLARARLGSRVGARAGARVGTRVGSSDRAWELSGRSLRRAGSSLLVRPFEPREPLLPTPGKPAQGSS
jgi:hypothetical protein